MGGSLNQEEINDLKNEVSPYSTITNFVETGTYKAETTILASKNFEKVFTIEIHEPLYTFSKKKCQDEGINNISFYLGDSLSELINIVPQVINGAVFFIDAHASGIDTSWNNYISVPLLEELDIILNYKIGPSVFIFDDVRLWKNMIFDWTHITNDIILNSFKKNNYQVYNSYEKNDRFFVFTI